MTQRAIQVLREANVIACEDTRRTRNLLAHFQIQSPARLVSYRQGNEERTGQYLIELIQSGQTVALCSDGGCPSVSDPGYRLVALALENGLNVQAIPGASASLTALMVSGLPTSSFTFKGYPPKKPGALRRFLEADKNAAHTLILYESPYRVAKTLKAALDILGNRRAAVCIELTKKFESVHRGYLSELVSAFESRNIKGEVTLVFAGLHDKFIDTSADETSESEDRDGAPEDETLQ
jgi:16S rRNA (cytidine1402-2'-O)-methyltransferase